MEHLSCYNIYFVKNTSTYDHYVNDLSIHTHTCLLLIYWHWYRLTRSGNFQTFRNLQWFFKFHLRRLKNRATSFFGGWIPSGSHTGYLELVFCSKTMKFKIFQLSFNHDVSNNTSTIIFWFPPHYCFEPNLFLLKLIFLSKFYQLYSFPTIITS